MVETEVGRVKRLLIASAVLFALSAAIWWSERHPAEPEKPAAPKVIDVKETDITSLEVTPQGGPATVIVKDDAVDTARGGGNLTAGFGIGAERDTLVGQGIGATTPTEAVNVTASSKSRSSNERNI